MKISSVVEPLVREALTAVVKGDPERLQRAFLAFPNDEVMTDGARIASAISLYVLFDSYGRRATSEEIRAVAEKVVELEDWTDITSEEVEAFLDAAYKGDKAVQVLPTGRIAPLAYVIAGNLLSSCHKEGEGWWDYLDRAEAAIEATSNAP
jgi:hypothetical protein